MKNIHQESSRAGWGLIGIKIGGTFSRTTKIPLTDETGEGVHYFDTTQCIRTFFVDFFHVVDEFVGRVRHFFVFWNR